MTWPYADNNSNSANRCHHLAKTFAGWQVTQAADGTLTWTSPHQAVYRTTPGSRIIFPEWNTHTPLPHTPPATPEATPEAPETASHRGLAMPRRRRTRQADETSRINTARNANRIANQATDAKLAQTLGPLPGAVTTRAPIPAQPDDPPPF
ncbi:hypothetical protein [Mycolicibacterium thermoresistibile]